MSTRLHDAPPPVGVLADLEPLRESAEPTAEDTASAPALLQARAALVRLPGNTVIGPFSLGLSAGERVAILGPSGAGKSTLLSMLAGDLEPASGSLLLEGHPLQQTTAADRALRRAVLPQSHGVAFAMPVDLVVSLGRFAREMDPRQRTIVAEALQAAQARHLAGRRFDTLSGGERSRVMLARVFAQLWDAQGALLLVDEPTAALDPALQLELTAALVDFCAERGHALVAVLHDINQALAAFDRLWLVKAGRLVADRPVGPDALPALAEVFGVALERVHGSDGGLAVLVRPAARDAP